MESKRWFDGILALENWDSLAFDEVMNYEIEDEATEWSQIELALHDPVNIEIKESENFFHGRYAVDCFFVFPKPKMLKTRRNTNDI